MLQSCTGQWDNQINWGSESIFCITFTWSGGINQSIGLKTWSLTPLREGKHDVWGEIVISMKNGSISNTPVSETVTSDSSITKSGHYLPLSIPICLLDHLVIVVFLVVIFLISRFLGTQNWFLDSSQLWICPACAALFWSGLISLCFPYFEVFYSASKLGNVWCDTSCLDNIPPHFNMSL